MRPKTMVIGTLLTIICALMIDAQPVDSPVLKGPYLGQKPPGMAPEIFAPGIISTDATEGSTCFSSDGNYVVFRRHFGERTSVYLMEQKNGTWTSPQLAPFFMKQYRFGDFTFAPNELKLYFASDRPLDGGDRPAESANLWVVANLNNQWLKPFPLGASINTLLHESYPSVSNSKTIYFFRTFDAENGTSEIMSSELRDGEYSEPKRLGKSINTEWDEWDPCISPDGEILVFCSKKPSGFGADDLYVSFKDEDGQWSEATNLGDEVNSPGSENRPFITADGKYLFYTSSASGNRDVYWISMDFVRRLKSPQ